jgi:hypothetical protein
LLAAIAGVFALAGCSGPPPREIVFPVKGEVFYEGKPAAGAVVFFHPMNAGASDNQNPATEPRPTGRVQEDGSFELTTYDTNDGAPAGSYRISVVWTKAKGGADEVDNLLPLEFMDPDKAGLPVIDVRAELNVLPPFHLAR